MPTEAAPSIDRPVPPTEDAEMDVPKSGIGKIAMMAGGVAVALAVGIGGALYFNGGGEETGEVPTVKRAEKIVKQKVSTQDAEVVSAPAKEPELPPANQLGRDQAFKVGMSFMVKGEFDKGLEYLQRAHELGHSEASYNLASMYAKGDGVERDFDKVVEYLKKSVEGGYHPAMTNLGLLYAQGQGVPQDFTKAHDLWKKAAEGEHPDAMHNLAVIYATGKGVERDIQEAIKWYRKGSNAGFVDSMFNLGLIYANGDGVPRDFNEAKRLWEMAAAKGHPMAKQNLAKLQQILSQQQEKQQ
jgi:TPR repeat protein